MYSTICSFSLRTKKNVKNTTTSCKNIVGKLIINFESEFTNEFVALVTKEWIIEPISDENASEAKKLGNIVLRGVMKSICCETK